MCSTEVQDNEPQATDRTVDTHGIDFQARLGAASEQLRTAYNTRPVRKSEWDEACGDPP